MKKRVALSMPVVQITLHNRKEIQGSPAIGRASIGGMTGLRLPRNSCNFSSHPANIDAWTFGPVVAAV